jgi:N-methylhydantoinase A
VKVGVKDVRLARYADMRYQSQEHTIKIRLPATATGLDATALRELFEAAYARRYGHSSPSLDVDLVNVRLTADGIPNAPPLATPQRERAAVAGPSMREVYFGEGFVACPVWQRDDFALAGPIVGPAIIEEKASTTVVHPGDRAEVDALGNIVITLGVNHAGR